MRPVRTATVVTAERDHCAQMRGLAALMVGWMGCAGRGEQRMPEAVGQCQPELRGNRLVGTFSRKTLDLGKWSLPAPDLDGASGRDTLFGIVLHKQQCEKQMLCKLVHSLEKIEKREKIEKTEKSFAVEPIPKLSMNPGG